MLKKTLAFNDFNGDPREMDFYFHLSEADLLDLEVSADGFSGRLEVLLKAKDGAALIREIRNLIEKSVGVKSDDGLRFIKNDEIRSKFMDSPAFSTLYVKLLTDPTEAAIFIRGVVPKNIGEKITDEAINEYTKSQSIQSTDSDVAPEQLTPVTFESTIIETKRPASEFSTEELVSMAQAEFDIRFGTDPKKWEGNVLLAAFRRKNK